MSPPAGRRRPGHNRQAGVVPDPATLDPAQLAYIQHRASVDFVVYNRVTNQPLLAIEVDGFAFHENKPEQRERDALKDEILAARQMPLLRLATTDSREPQRIRRKLDDAEADLRNLAASLGPDAKDAYVTTAEMLRAEGEARGKAEDILVVFEQRGIDVDERSRELIESCTNLSILNGWFRRVQGRQRQRPVRGVAAATRRGRASPVRPQSRSRTSRDESHSSVTGLPAAVRILCHLTSGNSQACRPAALSYRHRARPR